MMKKKQTQTSEDSGETQPRATAGTYLLDLDKNAEVGDVLLLCQLHGDVRRQLACTMGSG
jgi:hypothetical protein